MLRIREVVVPSLLFWCRGQSLARGDGSGVGWGGYEPVSPGAWLEGLSSQKKLCGSLIIMVSKYVKYCVGEKTYSGARTRLTVKTASCFARPHIFHSPRL